MKAAAKRLPGIRFEAETPQHDSDLPRMDVAAFVGFAASGPIGIPVAVESAAELRELFGGVLPLAWDAERGRASQALLGSAVEAFFANGGARAWIVRVAKGAHTFRFPVPGLVAADRLAEHAAGGAAWAEARARSAGSWAAELAVGTALERRTLPPVPGSPPAAFPDGDGLFRLDVAAPEGELAAGELVEVLFADGEPVLFLEVDRFERHQAGVRLEGTRGVWVDTASEPPAPAPAAAGAPWTARRLRFELLVWRGDELVWRLGDLAFSPRHPRSWTHLPADADLFGPRRGRPSPAPRPELAALLAEAVSPRFPLAGPEAAAGAPPLYLPLGMNARRERAEALPPAGVDEKIPALERDGVAAFSADLLLDSDFADVRSASLAGEMEHKYSVRGEALGGLHSLLPIEEVSLLALPDAVHPGWTRRLPEFPELLAAPEIVALDVEEDRLHVAWTEVDGATAYRLEDGLDVELSEARTLFEGPGTELEMPLEAGCPRHVFFRVRALRGGERGPFSATVWGLVPAADFEACDADLPAARELAAVPLTETSFRLVWQGGAADFELRESADPDFRTARPIYRGPDREFGPVLRRDGLWFYQVRAHGRRGSGPWSNAVAFRVAAGAAYVTEPWDEERAGELRALQRAALRFCAARADLMAVLSLPAGYRDGEALEHLAALRASLAGEEQALRYGALYHPWLLARRDTLRRVPADGAACGVMAAMSREAGAWRAPANRPLASVVALEPAFDDALWPRFFEAGINLVRRRPRGFLVMSSETLSRETDHRPIEVRRTLILLRRLALAAGRQYVFEPHDADLHARAERRFERLLGDLFVRGAFAGRSRREAFRVVSGAPGTDADRGRFVVELKVAPALALAFLTVRLFVTGPNQLAFQEI